MAHDEWYYDFEPHEKQKIALQTEALEVLYGGAAMGGKSEVLLAACIDLCTLIPGVQTVFLRKHIGEFEDIHRRIRDRVPEHIAKLNMSTNILRFANGSTVLFKQLASLDDAYKLQGFELQLACFDELTHYQYEWYAEVATRVRATGRIRQRMDELGIPLRVLSASNPGGTGHSWVKQRFIDPAPEGQVWSPPDGSRTRLFIQATFYDNPHAPRDYEATLKGSPQWRINQLLFGDWNIAEGNRFENFLPKPRVIGKDEDGEDIIDHPGHVIKPSQLPLEAVEDFRVVGVDWGISDPFAAVWLARIGDHVVAYREHVQKGLSGPKQAELLRDIEDPSERGPSRGITYVLDPASWNRNPYFGGEKSQGVDAAVGTIAHSYIQVLGHRVKPGWNKRVEGWNIVDNLLEIQDDGLPGLLIYDTCRELIAALQSAPRDKHNPNDVQKTPKWKDDHVLDAVRYGLAYLMGLEGRASANDEVFVEGNRGFRSDMADLASARW